MKAEINPGSKAFELKLTPETDEEKAILSKLAREMTRGYLITPRGFQYMKPGVEFYVQPRPSSD